MVEANLTDSREMSPKITYENPTPDEYNDLRKSVGWPTFDISLVEVALLNSLFSVVVREGAYIIAMGRIVGDGAIYLHVQDLIVRPAFQRQGIGRLIMKELLAFVEKSGGKNTNIGLMCSKGREKFYRDFGFTERPNERHGAGMIMILP